MLWHKTVKDYDCRRCIGSSKFERKASRGGKGQKQRARDHEGQKASKISVLFSPLCLFPVHPLVPVILSVWYKMASLMKWLIVGWSLVVVLLWAFLSFRQWHGEQALFGSREDVLGFMGTVFLTWIIPIAICAFFAFLAAHAQRK